MAPVLSASLILYRCGDEIDVALRCIQNADLEVSVFLCDNSPDEMTADRLKWAFPGVEVLPQKKNIGVPEGHNAVLPRLQSKYHLLLDPRVSFHPSLLRRLVSYMEAHPNIAVLSPRFFSEQGEELFLPRKQLSVRSLLGCAFGGLGGFLLRWEKEYTLANHEIEMPTPVDTAPLAFMLIRTEILKSMNGFDPRFSRSLADADLCRRILESRAGSVVYHPDLQVLLRLSDDPGALRQIRHPRLSSAVRYFIKWGVSF